MRVSIYVTPRATAPEELMPSLIQRFVEWRAQHRAKFEAFEFFAGAGGGMGILNVADEADLHLTMMGFPFGPYSNVDVRPIVDGDVALGHYQAMIAQMGG